MHRLKWFGFWTLLGLVSGAQLHLANQRFAVHPPSWWLALATGLSHWYLWGLLALVVAWLGRRFQVDRASFGRHFFIHLGASLDLALVHLVAAVVFQSALHALRGEPYAFAQQLVDNFTLFYHWNVLIYWAILAVVHALDYHRDLEERRKVAQDFAAQFKVSLPILVDTLDAMRGVPRDLRQTLAACRARTPRRSFTMRRRRPRACCALCTRDACARLMGATCRWKWRRFAATTCRSAS